MGVLDLVSALTRELSAERGVEPVARRGLVFLLRAFELPAGALSLYDESRGELRLCAAQGLALAYLRTVSRREVALGEDPVARAVLERAPAAGEAVVAFPLLAADRVLGVVEILGQPGKDLRLAQDEGFRALCDLIALVLDRNQLVGERDRCLAASRSLFDLSQAVPSATSIAELLGRIVQSAVRLLGGSSGCLATWDRGTGNLVVQSALNLPTEFTQAPLGLAQGLLGRVVQENRAMLVHNYESWPYAHPLVVAHGIAQAVGVPLRLAGEAAGVLAVGTAHPGVHFTWEDVDTLNSFADSAAIALANADLLRQTRLRADQMAALLKISRRLSESLRLEAVLATVLEEAVVFLEATAVALHLKDEQGGLRVAATTGGEEALRGMEELAGRAVREGEPAGGVDECRAFLVVPLAAGSDRIGALSCVRCREQGFHAEDLAFLWTLAGHAAMALENARLHEEAEERSVRDPLTGLYNMRRLKSRLDEEMRRAERYGRELSFLMLDIDHFKQYNDRFGHPQGDRVLQQVAEAVTRSVRTVDQVFRYGGEEMCVLLPETPFAQAILVAERIRAAVAALPEGALGEGVTVSLGVASYPRDASTPQELIARADQALYRAKARGRNRVVAVGVTDQARTVTTSSIGLRGR